MRMEINDLLKENQILREKVETMRKLLWEWNPSCGGVWEQRRLREIGETQADYPFAFDDEDGPDMPLFDFENG
jgi:hypothetical protein